MKVLVTGATGGMGGYIIHKLLEKGMEVIATSRGPEKIINENWFSKINYIPYNLSDKEEKDLYSFFKRPDLLIHLAWDKLKEHKNEAHQTTIFDEHKSFLSNLVRHGLKDITVIGTCYEYGLKEGELKETDPSAPVVAYAIGKNLLHEFLEELKEKTPFHLKWLRVFNVFSEGKSGGNIYSSLMSAIENKQEYFNMSGGEQVRDYLTAVEVTDIIVDVALQNNVEGVINCSSGRPIKLKDMIGSFLQKNNYSIKLNLGFYPYLTHEPMSHWGSVEKLNKALRHQKNSEK